MNTRPVVRPLVRAITRAVTGRHDADWSLYDLFRSSEQGWFLNPSDLASMYQDATGTTPVTGVEQPVGLMLDNRFGLARGPELRADFAAGSNGSGAALATYDPDTGEGTASRVDGQNQSFVYLTTVEVGRYYELTITNTGAIPLHVRTNAGATTVMALNGGESGTCIVNASGTGTGRFQIRSAADASSISFIIHSCREIPGNHFYQTTTANRPVLSARVNQLNQTDSALNSGAWNTSSLTGTLQGDGSTLLRRTSAGSGGAYAGTTYANWYNRSAPVGATVIAAASFKKATTGNLAAIRVQSAYPARADVVVDLDTGAVSYSGGNTYTGISAIVENEGDGWHRVTLTATVAGSIATGFYIGPATSSSGLWESANGTQYDCYVRRPQLVVNMPMPRYQRVTSATDYDTEGFPLYLSFDGTDDCLMSNSIDFTGTDKVTVLAGLTKLVDPSNSAVVVELSANSAENAGTFAMFGPAGNSATVGFRSAGTASVLPKFGLPAPVSAVLTGIGDIAAPIATLRVGGTLRENSTNTQGTGNYGNYPAFIGARNNATNRFNGRLYFLAVRGAETPVALIENVEHMIAARMKT